MQPLRRLTHLMLGLAITGLFVGCDDAGDLTGLGTGTGEATVGLSFAIRAPSGASASLFADELTLTDGSDNTLVITMAEMVIRHIEFKLLEDDCDETVDPDCDEFLTGPFVAELPLDQTVAEDVILADVAPGVYDEIHFDVHKLDEDDPVNDDLLMTRPELAEISIMVMGRYNQGPEFTYISDLNDEQKVVLADPLEVPENGLQQQEVTIIVDLDTWFRNAGDTLVDPTSALKGAPNENLVRDNIRDSIEGFRDDDHDGVPHGDDDDED